MKRNPRLLGALLILAAIAFALFKIAASLNDEAANPIPSATRPSTPSAGETNPAPQVGPSSGPATPGSTDAPTTPSAGATAGLEPAPGASGPEASGADPSATLDAKRLAAVRTSLATLPTKGRAPFTGYSRAAFGKAWNDVDHNGCDTRNDILNRDLTQVVHKPGTHDCVVLTGILSDPYTGRTVDFQRGPDTSPAIQIDHVVALADAWQKGAQQWDSVKRVAFANDPANLIAVSGSANQAKGSGDAATWLPAQTAYRCTYVVTQIEVKATYGLWLTPAEHEAMERVLAGC